LRRFFVLHARMQQLFNAWDRSDSSAYADATFTVMDIAKLRELQNSLDDPPMDDAALRERLERNFTWLESFARAWQAMAIDCDPKLAGYVNAPPELPRVDVSPLSLAPVAPPVPA
jgi:hypothetical protein